MVSEEQQPDRSPEPADQSELVISEKLELAKKRADKQRARIGALAQLFDFATIKLLDVGARDGAPAAFSALAPFSHYFGCEPEPEASSMLRPVVEERDVWRSATIIPEALAKDVGTTTLYVTHQPGLSSIYRPDHEKAAEFGLSKSFGIKRQLDVPCLTLEAAAAKYGFEDLAFIKLDTQGSELEILRSGEKLVRGSIQGVFLEAEFRPFYHGQPLFSEVELFLRSAGFELIHMQPSELRRASMKPRVGYSQLETTWAHALFIKQKPEGLPEPAALLATIRQIAIAMAFEHFDLAAWRLADSEFQRQLNDAGMPTDKAAIALYVRSAMSDALYRQFAKSWPSKKKTRLRYYLGG